MVGYWSQGKLYVNKNVAFVSPYYIEADTHCPDKHSGFIDCDCTKDVCAVLLFHYTVPSFCLSVCYAFNTLIIQTKYIKMCDSADRRLNSIDGLV